MQQWARMHGSGGGQRRSSANKMILKANVCLDFPVKIYSGITTHTVASVAANAELRAFPHNFKLEKEGDSL